MKTARFKPKNATITQGKLQWNWRRWNPVRDKCCLTDPRIHRLESHILRMRAVFIRKNLTSVKTSWWRTTDQIEFFQNSNVNITSVPPLRTKCCMLQMAQEVWLLSKFSFFRDFFSATCITNNRRTYLWFTYILWRICGKNFKQIGREHVGMFACEWSTTIGTESYLHTAKEEKLYAPQYSRVWLEQPIRQAHHSGRSG